MSILNRTGFENELFPHRQSIPVDRKTHAIDRADVGQ
jgi:hypothetical protein